MSMNKLAMFMLANGSNGINIEDIYAKETFSVSLVNNSTNENLELIVNKAFSSNLGGHFGMVNFINFTPRLNSSSYNAREISIGTVTTRQGSYGSDILLEGIIPVMFWGGSTKTSSGLLNFNHNQISLIHNGQITETDLETEYQYYIIGGGNLGVVNYPS